LIFCSRQIFRSRILGEDPAKIAALALVQEDFSALLWKVQAPTVILWGANDTVTPLRTGILLEAILPRARLQVIPLAGHVLMFDQPQLFNRAVKDAIIVREIEPPSVPAGPETRVGVCRGESGKNFTGAYDRIEITDCSDVRMTDITTRSMVIDRSRVVLRRGRFGTSM
jgi:hypothetical protein